MTDKERRARPRALIRVLVDYESSGTYLYDYSNDLSEGGLFIETEQPLQKGSKLNLRFTLPNLDKVFEITGKVAWVNQVPKHDSKPVKGRPGMGVQFVNMEAEDKAALEKYLSNHK